MPCVQRITNMPSSPRKNPSPKVKKTHICPTCNRSFSSKAGLARHRQDMHTSSRTGRRRQVKRLNMPFKIVKANGQPGTFSNSEASAQKIEQIIGRRGGGEWAFRALDPCSETSFSPNGARIPDQAQTQTAAMNFRVDKFIAPPSNLNDGDTWDCMIIALPFPELPFLTVVKNSNEQDWSSAFGRLNSTAANGVYPQSITFPALQYGEVTESTRQALTNGPTLGQYSEAFRTSYKGFSVKFNANALNDQGYVWAGQVTMGPSTSEVDPGDGFVYDLHAIAKLPMDVAALVSICPSYVRMNAREGVYLPIKFNGQNHEYRPCTWQTIHTNDQANKTHLLDGIELGYQRSNDSIPVDGTNPVKTRSPLDNEQPVVVSGFDNTQVGVAMFMGMGRGATLDFKGRMGVEAVASGSSPWNPFVAEAPMPDSVALEEFYTVQNLLAPAYPEKYNGWGWLIPVIGEAVARFADWGIKQITSWLDSKYNGPTVVSEPDAAAAAEASDYNPRAMVR